MACSPRRTLARGRVDGESVTPVLTAAAEIGRLTQRGQRGVQARDESVRSSSRRRLHSAGRAGKIGGVRRPGDEHFARGRVDSESVTPVLAAAPQIGRLTQRGRVRRSSARRKRPLMLLPTPAALRRLVPGKFGGVRGPGDEHVARGRVDGESETIVTAAPAEVGRLTQCGERGVQARDESVRCASRTPAAPRRSCRENRRKTSARRRTPRPRSGGWRERDPSPRRCPPDRSPDSTWSAWRSSARRKRPLLLLPTPAAPRRLVPGKLAEYVAPATNTSPEVGWMARAKPSSPPLPPR